MKRESLILTFFVFSLSTAAVIGATLFDGGWRVSVGAAYNAPSCVNLIFRPVTPRGNGQIAPPSGYVTKAEAEAKVNGTREGTVVSFEDGVFIDTKDTGSEDGGTWNARVKGDSWNPSLSSFEVAEAKYYEVSENAGGGRLTLNGEDSSPMPGVSVELSRNIYHNYEYGFGFDVAFMFSYFFRTDMMKIESATREERYNLYGLKSYITPMDEYDPYLTDSDGYYGAGNEYGPGPMFWPDVTVTDPQSLGTAISKRAQRFAAYGDYRELEMALALRPYYDLTDWLRLYGTIGVAVSWGEFDMHATSWDGDTRYDHGNCFHQWDVYGIGGLGLMLRWNDFTLGVDFFGRFLQDDLEIYDPYVTGHLERGKWYFRGMVGYEF